MCCTTTSAALVVAISGSRRTSAAGPPVELAITITRNPAGIGLGVERGARRETGGSLEPTSSTVIEPRTLAPAAAISLSTS